MSEMPFETPAPTRATFGFGEVSSVPTAGEFAQHAAPAAQPGPPLGPLQSFSGTFQGNGFNTIFRPNSQSTPTPDPSNPHNALKGDNVLELNDAVLNGVPYLQTIRDITPSTPGKPVIHVEPGLWMIVPRVRDQHKPNSPLPGALVRMASIPHGTTITAQGGSSQLKTPIQMKKIIQKIDITPFGVSDPNDVIPVGQARTNLETTFPSQTADDAQTARLPQDLRAAPGITEAMLGDPAVFIRNHSQDQNITSVVEITVNTKHGRPMLGGGISNIALLLGDSQTDTPAARVGTSDDTSGSEPNAQTVNVMATCWIQTVEYTVQVPAFRPGQPPLDIPADATPGGAPVPSFHIDPPVPVPAPRTIKVTATQIQYAQQVFLNFAGLVWPHVSVATLVPKGAVPVPVSAWT